MYNIYIQIEKAITSINQQSYSKTQVDSNKCPVCNTYITAFTKVDHTGRPRPVVRILNVPLVLRHDTTYEASNNLKSTNLFGHPYLIRLPSRVNAKDLYDVVKKNVPQEGHYTVHFVDGKVRISLKLFPRYIIGM